MALVLPFKGVRPQNSLAEKVAAPPYDVINTAEARQEAAGNPYSFLHINKPEIDLPPDADPYSPAVYQQGAANLNRFIQDGILEQDQKACFYVYRLQMGDHIQTGLVALASVEEYESGMIKKHEFTRPDKELDRVRHIDCLSAQVGPVFLCYKSNEAASQSIESAIAERQAEVDFTSADGVRHSFWTVSESAELDKISSSFRSLSSLYIADGHHRSAAASRVRQLRQAENPSHSGREPYNYFLSVIFPQEQMQILDYNRVVKDINGMSAEAFLDLLGKRFELSRLDGLAKPQRKKQFSMYFEGAWYCLEYTDSTDALAEASQLDVAILQDNLLAPVLGIKDPRTDQRIDFVGGIRGLEELQKRVDAGDYKVAFACCPTDMNELLQVADADQVMPPKSTWFEPKPKSGLVLHKIS